jgi:ubiquitin thioesterase protein OTUB1
VGVESDQIHIVAMANVFGVEIKIANLDTTAAETINYHEISAMEPLLMDNVPLVCLLYRPGHYDILYPK